MSAELKQTSGSGKSITAHGFPEIGAATSDLVRRKMRPSMSFAYPQPVKTAVETQSKEIH